MIMALRGLWCKNCSMIQIRAGNITLSPIKKGNVKKIVRIAQMFACPLKRRVEWWLNSMHYNPISLLDTLDIQSQGLFQKMTQAGRFARGFQIRKDEFLDE